MSNETIPLTSRKATAEEKFWVTFARDDFKASFARLEDTAKFLVTAVGVFAGLFTAALQIRIALKDGATAAAVSLPFWLWACSAIFAILVLAPLPYKHARNAPADIRRVYLIARWFKWGALLASALTFVAGLLIVAQTL